MIADLVVTKPEARRRRLLMLAEAARNLGRSKSWLRVETASGRSDAFARDESRPRLDGAVLDRRIPT